MIYATIKDGLITGYITPNGTLPAHKLHSGLRPVVDVAPVYNPATQAVVGTEDVILTDKVERRPIIGPKPPELVPEKVTETQFMRAAVTLEIVTADEAKAYLARGVIPAFVETAIAQIPANVRTDAELKIIGSDMFHRNDPVFAMLISGGAATSEQVDDLFRLAATLE
jgi:hypothetical protein